MSGPIPITSTQGPPFYFPRPIGNYMVIVNYYLNNTFNSFSFILSGGENVEANNTTRAYSMWGMKNCVLLANPPTQTQSPVNGIDSVNPSFNLAPPVQPYPAGSLNFQDGAGTQWTMQLYEQWPYQWQTPRHNKSPQYRSFLNPVGTYFGTATTVSMFPAFGNMSNLTSQ